MRKLIICILLFMFSSSLSAQEDYFNKRYYFDENFNISDISSVVATDSAYYATLAAIDTSLNSFGSVFVKFDLEGNVDRMTYHIDSSSALQTWRPTLTINQEGNFVTCGKYLVYDEDHINRILIIKMNETGEFIQTKEYYSPFFETDDFITPVAMSLCADGGYVVVNNISNIPNQEVGIWVTRFDVDFNLLWDYTMTYDVNTFSRSIKEDAEGNFIIGGYTHDWTPQHRYNLNSQAYLFKLDANGNLLWEYYTPEDEIWGHAYDLLTTADGGIVVASLEGEEWTVPIGAENDSVGYLLFEHTIFKLDAERNLEWKTNFAVGDRFTADETNYSRIIRTADNTGYVAGGIAYIKKSNEDDQHERAGWLTKVSPEGDSLWARHLYYLDTLNYANRIMDLDNAPDGGYIIGGVSFKYAPDGEAQQQGWLLKVDQYGCLIPGCQGDFVDTADEFSPSLFRILLYPNPAQEELYVHFQTRQFNRNNRFRIISLDGRVMREFTSGGDEGTFIIPVRNYPSGMYVLEYYEAAQLIQTQQFVKE